MQFLHALGQLLGPAHQAQPQQHLQMAQPQQGNFAQNMGAELPQGQPYNPGLTPTQMGSYGRQVQNAYHPPIQGSTYDQAAPDQVGVSAYPLNQPQQPHSLRTLIGQAGNIPMLNAGNARHALGLDHNITAQDWANNTPHIQRRAVELPGGHSTQLRR